MLAVVLLCKATVEVTGNRKHPVDMIVISCKRVRGDSRAHAASRTEVFNFTAKFYRLVVVVVIVIVVVVVVVEVVIEIAVIEEVVV